MGSAVSVGNVNACSQHSCSQFEQLGCAVRALLSSFCERTDTAFRRVYVTKQDAAGKILFYENKDKAGVVTKESTFKYIEEIKSGALFLDDTSQLGIRIKCVFAACAMPFYTVSKMAGHAMQTSLAIGSIAAKTLHTIGKLFCHGKCKESAAAMRSGVGCASVEFGKGLYEIVKAPLFGLGCELALLYGIAKPYHGKKFEGMIANTWQNGAPYDANYSILSPLTPTFWKDWIQDIHKPRTYYLAHCFQSHGNIDDARFTVIKREAL